MSRLANPRIRAFFLIGFAVTGMTLLTWLAYALEQRQTMASLESELSEVSRIKRTQLESWRESYIAAGLLASQNPFLYKSLAGSPGPETTALLTETLHRMAATLGISEALVCRADTAPVVLLPGSALRASDQASLEECLASRTPLLKDIVRYEGDRFSLDLFLPILPSGPGPSFCLILRRDAAESFYKLLEGWPKPSATAESLLVRQEGDYAVFISPLRKDSANPLSLRLPMSRTELPAVRSLLGLKGFLAGRDYRGVPVVSYVDRVAGTDWGLVVKVDSLEAYAPLRERMLYIGGLSFIVFCLLFAMVFLLFFRKESVAYRRLFSLADRRAELNQEFAATLLGIADGVISTDEGGKIRWLNDAAQDLLGQARDELLGRPLDEVFIIENETTHGPAPSPVREVLASGEVRSLDGQCLLVRQDGTSLPISDSAAPIRGGNGAIVGAVLVFHDARTERDLARAEAARADLYTRLFTDSAAVGLLVDPETGDIKDGNSAAAAFYGRRVEELKKLNVTDLNILPEDKVRSRLAKVAHKEIAMFKTRHKAAGGQIKDVAVYSGPIEVGGSSLLFSTIIDETAQCAAQAAQAALLKEKEVLLRELHHRTKNNLQVVNALLCLEAPNYDDPRIQDFFASMQGRLEAMALAHEKLYRSPDVSQIDLGAYLGELAALIAADSFDLGLALEAFNVPVDIASPCGLIINELLTNTRKYAFPSGRRGRAEIRLERRATGLLGLEYRDDGVGLPAGFDPSTATTLGLALVTSIAREQLLGTLSFGSGQGFSCAIEFDPRLIHPSR